MEDFILESKASRHCQGTGNSPKIDREAVLDQRRRLYYHLLPSRYLLWTTSKEIDRQEEALLSVNAVEFGFLYKLPTILTQIWCYDPHQQKAGGFCKNCFFTYFHLW